jgi:imidazole glycerol-phosphate synthase subunit HisH
MKNGRIVIVDYGMGNLHSVIHNISKLYADVVISSSKQEILSASKIIIPGVGHFAAGMKSIIERDIKSVLDFKALEEKVPVLGICLGMQLMTIHSEEGNIDGLRWIPAQTKRFNKEKLGGLKIPHMGWNTIIKKNYSGNILNDIGSENMFYFVHSYYVECENNENVLCSTNYGINFHSGIMRENIFGFQFHPEKSHDSGTVILKNFISL